jgi:hypothetical protein
VASNSKTELLTVNEQPPAVTVLRCALSGATLAIDVSPADGSVGRLTSLLSRLPGLAAPVVAQAVGSVQHGEDEAMLVRGRSA